LEERKPPKKFAFGDNSNMKPEGQARFHHSMISSNRHKRNEATEPSQSLIQTKIT
jgi:hypothetical protein